MRERARFANPRPVVPRFSPGDWVARTGARRTPSFAASPSQRSSVAGWQGGSNDRIVEPARVTQGRGSQRFRPAYASPYAFNRSVSRLPELLRGLHLPLGGDVLSERMNGAFQQDANQQVRVSPLVAD